MSNDNFMASTAMAEFQDESGTMRIIHGYNMESHGIDTSDPDSADTYVGGPPLAYKFLTDSQQTDMYTLLGGITHTRICASPELCTICGLHKDLRSICNSITVTNTREMGQIQPAEQQATTADETTIDATFHDPIIGIKFGRQGSSDQVKALAPTQIIKLIAGGEALREYDGILQVGMTLTKIQGVLLMNQIGYSYRRNNWVGSLIRNSDRPLVLTFQRPSSTADQPTPLIG